MQETEFPTLELQKEHWKYWNSRPGHPYEDDFLRPLRRGEKILGYLRSLPLERPTILDMGCGMGWFANLLAEFGPTTGIDLCDDAIAQAKSKFPQVTFMAGNVFEMELPEQHFDVVVSQEVIAHVPDQPGYVERAGPGAQAWRVLDRHHPESVCPLPQRLGSNSPGAHRTVALPGGFEAAPPAPLPRASDDDRCTDGAWGHPPPGQSTKLNCGPGAAVFPGANRGFQGVGRLRLDANRPGPKEIVKDAGLTVRSVVKKIAVFAHIGRGNHGNEGE